MTVCSHAFSVIRNDFLFDSRLPITPFCPFSSCLLPTIPTIPIFKINNQVTRQKNNTNNTIEAKASLRKEGYQKVSPEISDAARSNTVQSPPCFILHTSHISPFSLFQLQLECCPNSAAYTIKVIPPMFVYKKKHISKRNNVKKDKKVKLKNKSCYKNPHRPKKGST